MSANSLGAMKIAIEMAEKERDEAAAALARAENEARQAQAQSDQLSGYAQETNQRWAPAGRMTATPEVLRHHYLFMQRLDQVIGMQAGVVQRSQAQVSACNQKLVTTQTRLEALRTVMKGMLQKLAQAESRREQKQTDETATRQSSLRVRSNGGTGYGL